MLCGIFPAENAAKPSICTRRRVIADAGNAAPFSDVIVSLSSMGYDKKLVEQKVLQLVEVLKGDKDFASKSQKEKEDILFRRVIVELA